MEQLQAESFEIEMENKNGISFNSGGGMSEKAPLCRTCAKKSRFGAEGKFLAVEIFVKISVYGYGDLKDCF